jgi:cation-transporting ATPase E
VAEGRRVTANIERVANLFLTKTTYAALLAVAIVVTGWSYPFLPRHLTVVSSLTIGIPAFFLALAPNTRRYLPGFVTRVLRFAIPAGFVAATAVFLSYWWARIDDATVREARTTATIVLLILGLWVLVLLARPFTRYRTVLVLAMIGMFLGAILIVPIRDFYALRPPPADVLLPALAIAVIACAVLEAGYRWAQRRGNGSVRATYADGRTGTAPP